MNNFIKFVVSVISFSIFIIVGSKAFSAEEPRIKLEDMSVFGTPHDIGLNIESKNGIISCITIHEVRSGSMAERIFGFRAGTELVSYRGQKVQGITDKEFAVLRERPVASNETEIAMEVKDSWGGTNRLVIPIPLEAFGSEYPVSFFDRLYEGSLTNEIISVEDIPLDRFIDLSKPKSKDRLKYEPGKKLMDWQISSLVGNRNITWAHPVILKGEMIAWRVGWKASIFETAKQVRIGYVPLKGDWTFDSTIEAQIRAQYEKSRKSSDPKIVLFSLLCNENKKVLGFYFGEEGSTMFDQTDYIRDKKIMTKEEKMNRAPNSDSLYRGNNDPLTH